MFQPFLAEKKSAWIDHLSHLEEGFTAAAGTMRQEGIAAPAAELDQAAGRIHQAVKALADGQSLQEAEIERVFLFIGKALRRYFGIFPV